MQLYSYYKIVSRFCPSHITGNARKPYKQRTSEHCSCGGRTRTCDLQVMSLASYQLLHSAILTIKSNSFPNCECKGMKIYLNGKIIKAFFLDLV